MKKEIVIDPDREAFIPGHSQYIVNRDGEVYRVADIDGDELVPRRLVKVFVKRKGKHPYVTLMSKDVKQRYNDVSRPDVCKSVVCTVQMPVLYIVGRAFCKGYTPSRVPMPMDFDVSNVKASNIRWVTRKYYIEKMSEHGAIMGKKERSERLRGIERTRRTRNRISISKTGINNPRSKWIYFIDDRVFDSPSAAADYSGLSVNTTIHRCRNSYPGYDARLKSKINKAELESIKERIKNQNPT